MPWILSALLASLFDSLRDLYGKHCINNFSPVEVAFFLRLTIAIIFLPFLWLAYPQNISPNFFNIIFSASSISIVSTLCYLHVLKTTDFSQAAPIMASSPIIASIFAYFLLLEIPSSLGLLGICCSVYGVFNLTKVKSNFVHPVAAKFYSPTLLLLFAASLNGFGSVIDKFALKEISPMFYLASVNLFLALIYAPISIRSLNSTSSKLKTNLKPLILLGLFGAASLVFYITAMHSGLVAYVSCVKRSSIFWSLGLAALFLKENNIRQKLGAAIWINLGTLLLIFA